MKDKTTETLCAAITTCWFQTFGPFKCLVVDGESGIFSTGAEEYFRRHGIVVRQRAPGQHARIVERRGSILRHAMHCIEEQLKRDEVTVGIEQLLAEAVFAGNALVTYNAPRFTTPGSDNNRRYFLISTRYRTKARPAGTPSVSGKWPYRKSLKARPQRGLTEP